MQTSGQFAGATCARGKLIFPLADARRLSVREQHWLQVLDYRITPKLPSGSAARTYSYAPLQLAGSFLFEAQITRDANGKFWMELPVLVYDQALDCRVPMAYSLPLVATICQCLQQRHILTQARQHTRNGAGRN